MWSVRHASWFPLLLLLSLCPLALQACAGAARQRRVPVKPDDPGFYDYSTPRVTSLAEFQQLAAVPAGVTERTAVAGAEFVITNFSEPAQRKLHFLDGRYYQFHDEWAWFRLLNGQSVAGMDAMEPHSFKSPEEARRWAIAHEDDLPEGLEVTDGRLYARHFYDLTLSEGERPLGAGSLINVEARAQRVFQQPRAAHRQVVLPGHTGYVGEAADRAVRAHAQAQFVAPG